MTRFLDLKKSREILQGEFSLNHNISFSISRPFLENSRFDGTNSQSRLEARNVEDTNLDLVSRTTRLKKS